MFGPILDPDYDAAFVDTERYQPATITLLKGLAAAIQDSCDLWRPVLSELAEIVEDMDKSESDPLVLAGVAYGAGKQLSYHFPGPSLLMFTAAVDGIGEMPRVELREAAERARELLREKGLLSNEHIRNVLNAAFNMAAFEMVVAKQKYELSEGLRQSGRYEESRIEEIVKEIVDTSAKVRHEGIVYRFGYIEAIEPPDGFNFYGEGDVSERTGDTGVIFLNEKGDELVPVSYIQYLIPYAQIGCAYAIRSRLFPYRKD